MIIDLLFVGLALMGFYIGYKRGLIKTIFAILSILIGILAALKLSPIVITILQSTVPISPEMNFILGFVLTFFLIMLLIRFIGSKLEGILKAIKINLVNKVAGGAFLSIFFIVCFSFFVWFLDNARFIDESTKEKSISYAILEPLPEASKEVFSNFKPLFENFWNKTVDTMDKIKEKGEEAYEDKNQE